MKILRHLLAVMLLLVLALISGCAAIGVELIGPAKADRGVATVHGSSLRWQSNRLTSVTSDTTQLSGLRSLSTNEIVQLLGSPSEQGTSFIRYHTGARAWHGLALDLAIFPIPLTLPLMVPGGKTGYVDFVSDGNRVKVVGYGPSSRFYGFGAGDNEAGFYWGTPGFWFNLD